MKLKTEICADLSEPEIIIRCSCITPEVRRLQRLLGDTKGCGIVFFKENEEFYLCADEILFFETQDGGIRAHTAEDSFEVKEKLFELEQILPFQFIRVSKSAILNVDRVYSVEKSITSASLVKFVSTHKRIYISRSYYKDFKKRILERRSVK